MKRLILLSAKSNSEQKQTGFTLVELLIVLTIVAILAVATVLILNPSEILKKSRDTQRMSDLSSIKSAIALYLTTSTTTFLGGAATDAGCVDSGVSVDSRLYVSVAEATTNITDATPPIDPDVGEVGVGWTQAADSWGQVTTVAELGEVDGTGWIPVKLTNTTGGAAISNFPIDPNQSVTAATVTNADNMYRYACRPATATKGSPPSTFEIDANLESSYYTSGTTNAEANDGGNNTALYEAGTDLSILPSQASDF